MFPVEIHGPRVLLREFVESDWVRVHEYAKDPEVTKYETWGPNSEEMTRAYLRFAMKFQNERPRRVFELAIALKDTGELIGACGLRINDVENNEGNLGYTLHRDYWGRGLATETALCLVRFGFDTLRLHRIWATCHVSNTASAHVLEKAGMRREGILRQNKLQRGEWRDSYLYAILESDPPVRA